MLFGSYAGIVDYSHIVVVGFRQRHGGLES